mmetsp:Transcript_17186/g.34424  ORF Transcript_17186/g.34424 Transcript_17186/m.34424 type:complete len:274 (+) Transcript_17186:257-1078(+)
MASRVFRRMDGVASSVGPNSSSAPSSPFASGLDSSVLSHTPLLTSHRCSLSKPKKAFSSLPASALVTSSFTAFQSFPPFPLSASPGRISHLKLKSPITTFLALLYLSPPTPSSKHSDIILSCPLLSSSNFLSGTPYLFVPERWRETRRRSRGGMWTATAPLSGAAAYLCGENIDSFSPTGQTMVLTFQSSSFPGPRSALPSASTMVLMKPYHSVILPITSTLEEVGGSPIDTSATTLYSLPPLFSLSVPSIAFTNSASPCSFTDLCSSPPKRT